MHNLKLAVLAAGLLTAFPVLAQTAGNTPNTGPQGTGNFVAGQTGRSEHPGRRQAGRYGKSGRWSAGRYHG